MKRIFFRNLFHSMRVSLLSMAFIALMLAPAFAISVTVPGTADPWLAGMPEGSRASTTDIAPDQSPVEVLGLPLIPGYFLTFTATGAVKNGPIKPLYGPDGNDTWILSHFAGAENGISDVTAPIDALLGVLLGPDQPSFSPAPSALDFGTSSSRDYTILSPQLQQVFFIGDGNTGEGIVQKVIVPPGAERLYLGVMDGFEWLNNGGTFNVEAEDPPFSTVPEPVTMILLSSGLLGFVGFRKKFKR